MSSHLAPFGALEREVRGAVAVLDVLGFKDRVTAPPEASPSEWNRVALDTVVGPTLAAASAAWRIVDRDLRKLEKYSGKTIPRLEWMYYTDSIALWLPELEDHRGAEATTHSMIFACSLIVAACIGKQIPLRGAIAYGDAIVSTDPPFYLGAPFLDAHELESKQSWAGVALAESAARHTPEDSLRVVEWPVPVGNEARNLRAVCWPGNCSQAPDWDVCFSNPDGRVQAKKNNTAAFYDAHKHLHMGPGIGSEFFKSAKWRDVYGR